MKLTLKFRDVTPTPALLDYVKAAIGAAIRPHPWAVSRLRASIVGEPGDAEWARCRLELGLRGGGVRVFEVASTDAFVAVDVVAERLAIALENVSRASRPRRTARAA